MAPISEYSILVRAQCLTLRVTGMSAVEICRQLGPSPRQVRHWMQVAKERGYNPDNSIILKDEYLIDKHRSGRPPKLLPETVQEVLVHHKKDRYAREKSAAQIGFDFGVSDTYVQRLYKTNKIHKRKPTRKPGLTKAMKAARLQWCIQHQDWTLEDWKNVIWTDETSVVLGHKRGSQRVWRTAKEAYEPTCIRNRFKGFTEFMFWGSFSYDKKGPCHIWEKETPQEKRNAERMLEELNNEAETTAKAEWELRTAMGRLGLRNKGGRKPMWKWCRKTGKLTRDSQGGIDWWRYQQKILLPLLLPFAQECMKERPNTIVQEDGAPSHRHTAQNAVFETAGITRLLWPGNSPDINMIEPCWPYMKRSTTAKGAPTSQKQAAVAWKRCWEDMDQVRIQRWIERIPRHIQQIIKLEGGNEYHEGATDEPLTGRARLARRNY